MQVQDPTNSILPQIHLLRYPTFTVSPWLFILIPRQVNNLIRQVGTSWSWQGHHLIVAKPAENATIRSRHPLSTVSVFPVYRNITDENSASPTMLAVLMLPIPMVGFVVLCCGHEWEQVSHIEKRPKDNLVLPRTTQGCCLEDCCWHNHRPT